MPTVNDIYQQVLGRPAEPEGLAYWKSVFGDYVDDTELAQFKTAAAPEIAQRASLLTGSGNTTATSGGTAAVASVADLYQQVLGRAPESKAVVDEWTRLFGSTIDASEVAQFKDAAQLEIATPNISNIKGQILAQGNIDKWTGSGKGSAEANATDMATILAGIGITDISQFGALPGGKFGNKVTGQEVPNTYGERQTGNAFGGTFAGKGNTGYRVNFDATGKPIFYTTSASSADVPNWVKAAIIAVGAYVGLDASGLLATTAGTATTALTATELAASGLGLTASEIAALTATDLAIGGGGLAGTATALTAAELAALGTGVGGLTAAEIAAAAEITAKTAADKLAADTLAASALKTGATALTVSQIADLAKAGLTVAQIAQISSGLLSTAGSVAQSAESKAAAIAAANKIQTATDQAVLASQFRPIGMTTRFGTSNFAFDPVTGRMIDANYNLSPEAKAQQDRLAALANAGLTQAEGAQAQFAPLQKGAQSLFGLGQGFLDAKTDPRLAEIASQYLSQSPESKRLTALGGDYLTESPESKRLRALGGDYLTLSPESQQLTTLGKGYLTQSPESQRLTALGGQYLAQSPEQVAQNYLNQQMALLQPGRELELANLQNRLQQQGRGGLAVAQGGALGATTPELQALYNARAQQEAQLAASAQQAGQQQVQFGAGLVGTGQQLGIQGQQFGANLIGTGQQLGMAGQQFGANLIGTGQDIGIKGQQFGANLIGTGQQLGIQGQQFGMDTLARQQALEQQRLAFGSGLFSQGSGLLGQYYSGQQAAYAPYTTAMGQVQNLEQLAQQPFNTSLALAQQQAQAGFNAGQLGIRGAQAAGALTTSANATTNPYAQLAIAAGQPGSAFGSVLGGLFGAAPANWDFSAANPYAALNPYFTATP
jgi:hypothetical protein